MTEQKQKRPFTLALAFAALLFVGDGCVQTGYIWFNDDAAEGAASAMASENTPANVPQTSVKRVRIAVAGDQTSEFVSTTGTPTSGTLSEWALVSVVDEAAGFVYVGTDTAPARVLKVRMSDFTLVDALTLDADDLGVRAALIDVAAGFAYFATDDSPTRIVKVRLSDFTRVGAITLESGEDAADSGDGAVIDVAAGFAYFATETSPGQVVKVDLDTFTRVGALSLSVDFPWSAIIDPDQGFAYFGTNTSPGQIAKVDLDSFTEVLPALTLEAGEDGLAAAAINVMSTSPTDGYAIFGTSTSPGIAVIVDLADFTRKGALVLDPGDDSVRSIALQPNDDLYLGLGTSPGRVVPLAADYLAGTIGYRDTSDVMQPGEDVLETVAFVPNVGCDMYFGTYAAPAFLVRYNSCALDRTDAISLQEASGDSLTSAVSDPLTGFSYFGANQVPGMIIKFNVETQEIAGKLTLDPGEDLVNAAVIDPEGGFAYFGTATQPSMVIKVRLSDFTRVGSVTLTNDGLTGGVIDKAAGFAYFWSGAGQGKVFKIRLSDLVHVDTLLTGLPDIGAGVIDPAEGFAYFATFDLPSDVLKVRLSDFTVVDTLAMEPGEDMAASAVIDTLSTPHFAYFGTNTSPGQVVQLDLSTFTRVGAIALNPGEDGLWSAAIDAANGYAFFGTRTQPGNVVQVDLDPFSRLDVRTIENDPLSATFDEYRNYVMFGSDTSPGLITPIQTAREITATLEYGEKETTCDAVGTWTQVPDTATVEPWEMAASSFIVDGELTSDHPGLSPGNIYFIPGRATDVSSDIPNITFGDRQYTEVEYAVRPTANAVVGTEYCFRITAGGDANQFTYQQYAEATVAEPPPPPPPGGSSCSPTSAFIVRPNGGETYASGSPLDIYWNLGGCVPVDRARLAYSTDSGTSWQQIVETTEHWKGVYNWTAPGVSTNTARVKIDLLDSSGAVMATDQSDADFSITGGTTPSPPPPPTGDSFDPSAATAASPNPSADRGWSWDGGPRGCGTGLLLRGSAPAVYYCGDDGKKHVFLNEKTFKTWYADFSHVVRINDDALSAIPTGDAVRYRPGVRMVKLTTDPKVYAVDRGGVLRWVENEQVAASLYGANWASYIDDMPPELFDTYPQGPPISRSASP